MGELGTLEEFGGEPQSKVGESGRKMRRSNSGFIIPHWIRATRWSDMSAFVIAECSCTPLLLSQS